VIGPVNLPSDVAEYAYGSFLPADESLGLANDFRDQR
jgi:hypothetical protein